MVRRGLQLAIGVAGAVLALGPAPAPAENLDAGKTPQALFAGTCESCHKTPRGLAKSMGANSLASFLNEHYTASPQTASALAAYLVSVGGEPPKSRDAKPGEAKRGEPTAAAPAADQGKRRPAETEGEKKKQATARRPELDERLPQAHEPREPPPHEEAKQKGRAKRQDARTQTNAAPITPPPEAASAAPPPAATASTPAPATEPAAVAQGPAETPDQPAFSVPSP